jgi:hypothetical protein
MAYFSNNFILFLRSKIDMYKKETPFKAYGDPRVLDYEEPPEPTPLRTQGIQGGMSAPRKSFANQFLAEAGVQSEKKVPAGRKDLAAIQK